MPDAAHALHIVLASWVAALAGLVTFRVVTRRIRVAGLLSDARRRVSPERLQMLVASLAIGGTFAIYTLRHGEFPAGSSDDLLASLTSPPALLAATLGGSQTLYLLGKLLRRS